MIEFLNDPAPTGAEPSLLDYGFLQRPSSGAPALRIDRPGSRYSVAVTFPPMKPDVARTFVARLQRAKREGLRIEYPLLDLSQGNPGAPLVNGAGQSGTTLDIKGLTPHYVVKEGYALTIIEAATGDRFLHFCLDAAAADASGLVTIEIEPPLRAPFANNDVVLLAKPTVEGWVTSDITWSLRLDRLIDVGATIVIEEAA